MSAISPAIALEQLTSSGNLFLEVFRHGSLVVEIYRPEKVDLQQPHTRDEIYVVVAGTGQFECGGVLTGFGPGDFLFVPAFVPHRFVDFSEDFSTWVFFYGPEGGE
ncbi:MAG: cupin domain-containing protein [Saprospiraceae bacterium]|nr:cupin domain-containing protein [Saprospiraceae bacterium]